MTKWFYSLFTQCWFGHAWELRVTRKYGGSVVSFTYVCEHCLATKTVHL
jgi:hypothetical protein